MLALDDELGVGHPILVACLRCQMVMIQTAPQQTTASHRMIRQSLMGTPCPIETPSPTSLWRALGFELVATTYQLLAPESQPVY